MISGFIFLIALVLVGKLYFVQIVHGDVFRERADQQYSGQGRASFNRGAIYFVDKDDNLVSAATLKNGYSVVINPKLIKEPEQVYEGLNSIVPIDRQTFMLKAGKKNDPHEEIVKRISIEEGEAIEALKLPGVFTVKERWRYYPGDNLASQTLGFVGFKGDVLAGRYGLERFYDDVLGRNEDNAYSNFFVQVFSNIRNTLSIKGAESEGDIVLTIDPTVQSFLAKELKDVLSKRSGEQVGGIIMNPQNGEIYALAASPDFNPNAFQEVKEQKVFSNPMIEGVYEMGSIIKPLTMAAGLDAGVVTPATTYYDAGYLVMNNARIANYDGKGRGQVNMQEVLNQSLNTGVAYVVTRMGNKKFAEYFKNYGLGEETGIDLPNEASGLVKNLESPRDIEHATASFGQGIALTPIATARALASLGNGGLLITPHVVKKIDYKFGVSKVIDYGEGKRVLKPGTSEEISRMLVKVVDDALVGGKAKLEHYSVAAKTGTAQIANPATGKYYEDRYLHSFFGYFPAYEPKFLIFFYILDPRGTQYASETWTDSFSKTAKFLISYYNVLPDR